LEADSFELSSSFNALIHCGSDGAYGNVNEYTAKSSFDLVFRTRQFKKTYEGFLSEEEIENVLKGQDLWLDAPSWHARAISRGEYYKAKADIAKEAEENIDTCDKEELSQDNIFEGVSLQGVLLQVPLFEEGSLPEEEPIKNMPTSFKKKPNR
jgi:hypothetical protein